MLGLVLGLAVLPFATASSQTESASFSRAQDTHLVSLEPDENFGGRSTNLPQLGAIDYIYKTSDDR